MKKIIAVAAAFFVLCAGAFAQSALPMDFSGAFGHPSDEFSMETAFFVLSSFMQQDAQSANDAFAAMGFEVVKQAHYDKDMPDPSHTSAYTLAKGHFMIRGELRQTAVVTVRGTSGGEWYSNFDFAGNSRDEAEYAENFKAAADDIFAGIKDELAAMEEPVIIATGYSRGAACANLLGEMLNENYDPEDVYVYTFATPNTVRGEHAPQGNIFNVVNMNDMVTRMPPVQWGFYRLGTDIELRDDENINVTMHMMFMEMLGLCPDIDSYYADRHSLTGYGPAADGATAFEVFSVAAGALAGDETAAAQLGKMLESSQTAPNDFTSTLVLFMGAGDGAASFAQHMPDVYVQLMMEIAGL